ncbi:SlyX family protein [Halioxenophilus sp. WMMB6]|uniref:SlyX family protein n=1 Tax=Halioxenophilus sp. WMMB6 TaxID=3073815 RepID=UPI00295E3A60|nr:SlyX family protein [Halioxenophilus sp. WMMB6]
MNTEQVIVELREQVAELQTRVSFQEDTLAALDQVISRQDRELTMLTAQFASLAERMRDMQFTLDERDAGDERPPHY